MWIDLVDSLAAESDLHPVIAPFVDVAESEARGVVSWVSTDGPVPTVVMPRDADREMANREVHTLGTVTICTLLALARSLDRDLVEGGGVVLKHLAGYVVAHIA